MADIGSYILPYIQKLPGFVDSQGIIIPEQAENATDTIEFLKQYYPDLDISVNSENKIVIDDTVCNTPTELSTKLTEEAEARAENEYFKDNDVYVGIITTTGVNDFARALSFANNAGANVREITGDSYAIIACKGFTIRVKAYNNNEPASIAVDINPGSLSNYIDVFNTDNPLLNAPYIKYMICKGSSGDCYVKGMCTNDPTPPSQDNYEEEFADCQMGTFRYSFVNGEYVLSKDGTENHGGFAIIGMDNRIDSSKQLGDSSWGSYSSYDKQADTYAFVLWSPEGVPLIVHSNEIGRGAEIEISGYPWNRIVTNASAQLVSLAPIFCPSSKTYVSTFSYWAMISSKDGVYELNAGGFGQSYRFDHGFVMNV